MAVSRNDLIAINANLRQLKGQAPWSVKLGHGSFVTMDFGKRVLLPRGKECGEWHLWIYFAAWRLDSKDEILAGSEDEADVMAPALAGLTGLEIHDISATAPSLSLEIDFGDRMFRAFPINSTDDEQWMLYLPSGKVLVVGPGANWAFSR